MASWQLCNDLNLHGIPQIRLHVQAGSITPGWAKTVSA
jgi:hypothetical protein